MISHGGKGELKTVSESGANTLHLLVLQDANGTPCVPCSRPVGRYSPAVGEVGAK